MRSGSIDMILTPEDEYVFLEVNPVGQFQWVAEHCNYPINQKIAEYLIMNAYDGASPERNKEMDKGKQGQSSGDD